MVQTSVLITLKSDSQPTIDEAIKRLDLAGLQAVRSFDLKIARTAHVDCSCPNHGTSQCDCQMVVLLVYGKSSAPVTLVIHGHDGQTQISLVEPPELRPSPDLIKAITKALIPIDEQGRKHTNFRLEERPYVD